MTNSLGSKACLIVAQCLDKLDTKWFNRHACLSSVKLLFQGYFCSTWLEPVLHLASVLSLHNTQIMSSSSPAWDGESPAGHIKNLCFHSGLYLSSGAFLLLAVLQSEAVDALELDAVPNPNTSNLELLHSVVLLTPGLHSNMLDSPGECGIVSRPVIEHSRFKD